MGFLRKDGGLVPHTAVFRGSDMLLSFHSTLSLSAPLRMSLQGIPSASLPV